MKDAIQHLEEKNEELENSLKQNSGNNMYNQVQITVL